MSFAGLAVGPSLNGQRSDTAEVARALALLIDPDPGSAFELRAVALSGEVRPAAVSQLFNLASINQAVEWAKERAAERTVYIGLNPVPHDLPLGPGRAVRAADVLRRRWLLVDVDPVRAPGCEGDSATAAEKAAAAQLAGRVWDYLRAAGWPEPVQVDSGNGAYLLFRTDLPNDVETQDLVRRLLARLGSLFNGADGRVDEGVHDAPRIVKLPGVWARKGPGTPERPHRLCQLTAVPDPVRVVTREQLLAVAASAEGNGRPSGDASGHDPTLGFAGTAGGGGSIVDRAVAYLASCPPAVSGNGGHDQTFAVARAVVWGFDLGPDVGFDLLWRHYNPRCLPPWSGPELRHKCKDADEKPFDRPRGWLLKGRPESGAGGGSGKSPVTPGLTPAVTALGPYRPFPTSALPPPLDEYVRQAAAALGCDPAFVALPVLAAAASAVGNTRAIRLKRGWEEPAVVWAAIVGESGTLKSPAQRKAVAYLFRLQKQLLKAHKEQMEKYKEALKSHKGAQEEGADPGPPPDRPVLKRVVCSDTTVEKLAEVLEDNPRGVLVARDELAGWLASFCRYKGRQGGTDLQNWLELSQAGTLLVDRKTGVRVTIMVSPATVSVAGGIQPGVLARALTPEFLDAGLAARLLLAMPVPPPKRWSDAEVDPGAEQAYQDVIDKLLALDFGADPQGEEGPHALRLSPDAKAAWVAFYNAWAREQAAAEGEMAAAFSKLEGYAARFALLHHVVSLAARGEDDRVPVGRASIDAGAALCRWFAGEARRIYATLTESKEERAARKLVEFVRARGGRITARALQRSNSRKYPSAAHAEAALNALTPAYGGWEDGPTTTPKGGQLARHFRLHPTLDNTDTTAPGEEFAEDGPPPGAADTTADATGPPPRNPGENLGSVGSVTCRAHTEGSRSGEGPRPVAGAGPQESRSDALIGRVGSPTGPGAAAENPDQEGPDPPEAEDVFDLGGEL
jgi:hypothetical protein